MSTFAQDVYAINPGLTAESDILDLGYKVVKQALGARSARYYFCYHEDFPADLLNEYLWIKQHQPVDQ